MYRGILRKSVDWNYEDMQVLLQRFYHCKREAQFLFDKKLAAYLDSLYEGVEDHFLLEARLQIEGAHLETLKQGPTWSIVALHRAIGWANRICT
jgi:hypothetical protein